MKLKSYLTLTTIATTSSVVIVLTIAILYLLQSSYQSGLEARGLELARVIAHDPKVIQAVRARNLQQSTTSIEDYIEAIRSRTDASYIVVVDKQAIRLSHPDKQRIGKHFIGEDIYPVLQTGKAYSTEARGSLGKAIRNFVPIYDNGELIGAICIGYLSEKISDIIFRQHVHIGLLIGLIYLFGIGTTVAFLLKMKKTFLDYEPEFIVNKFREHGMVFDSIRDAIIAVDHDMKITMINNSAMKLLSMGVLSRYDYQSHPLSHYSIPLSHLVLENQGRFHQEEFSIGKLRYRANLYPIKTAKGLIGHVIVFFANLTPNELEKEITYLKNYAELLRSKTHEYSNKLNVLSGMLQIGKYEESIDFIQQETDRYQAVINHIVLSVSDSAVAGLLLAKFNKASEMGVKFTIDEDTTLAGYAKQTSEKLVTILGNLVDNALLAAWQNREAVQPEVSVYLSDRGRYIMLEIQDNGTGVPDEIAEHILEFGVSSKQEDEQNGIGLYLVKQLVDYFHGSIDWERTDQNTTLFSIYLEKKEEAHDDENPSNAA
ncbi:ATP-binding protein [Vibrio mangrovi]|uniref:histidine kinase n=1 Tax=Vibrio mangrovi TaxID=474394 RepID=A0A1Y6J308_9VIBR|nr:sensor histidine kinase [Vibrio mangrovi]MDW6004415.1 sensor histidine kinase [Vibrio mangrovi]SMS03092.1 Sensor histidine kinase DcuS [Vibrio mangrovi]